jgi:hypothetical protein
MKFSTLSSLAAVGTLAAAEPLDKRYWTSLECMEKTVTETVTVTAPAGGAQSPAPSNGGGYVYTGDGKITSVDYHTSLTSWYNVAAGTYTHPYKHGEYITATAAGPTQVCHDSKKQYSFVC